ncbi:LAMI_0G05270g1_1 [Lachancea mirantina]|uniref:Stationary phase protein 4 n=1 Tax=Lachancea mirantina TaxID=1230905 RepID=A0A1G4K8Y0_9SACH|nr:LAMI_0G05270g1_1 [Lachancea mirantina]
MAGLFDAFEVYNRKKHSSNPTMFGGNHSNIGTNNTGYMFAHEYQKPKDKDLQVKEALIQSGEAPVPGASPDAGAIPNPNLIDISNMSQAEFERVYRGMRKGEPNNRVNF